MPDEKIVIKTKHGELSLEQLAEAQHGMAHLMKEVGERYHVLYYAGKALNWKLAQYQLNQVIALFRIGATLRPKFTEDLNGFVKTHFHPMSEAIRAQDWRRFEEAFKKGIQASDQFHEKYGYGYIHFVLPKNPPEMYNLTPRSDQVNDICCWLSSCNGDVNESSSRFSSDSSSSHITSS